MKHIPFCPHRYHIEEPFIGNKKLCTNVTLRRPELLPCKECVSEEKLTHSSVVQCSVSCAVVPCQLVALRTNIALRGDVNCSPSSFQRNSPNLGQMFRFDATMSRGIQGSNVIVAVVKSMLR